MSLEGRGWRVTRPPEVHHAAVNEQVATRVILTAVIAVVLLVVFALPVVFEGGRTSALDLLILSGGILAMGLLLRSGARGNRRRLGSLLAIIGVISLAGVFGLIWLMGQGLGRPY